MIDTKYVGDLEVQVIYGGEGLCKTMIENIKSQDMQVTLNEIFEAMLRSIDQLSQGDIPDNAIPMNKEDYDKDLGEEK